MTVTETQRKKLHELLDKALDQEMVIVAIVTEEDTSAYTHGATCSDAAFYLMNAYKKITSNNS